MASDQTAGGSPTPPCTGCGRQFESEETFCPSCGTARDGAARPADTDRRLEAEWAKVRAALEAATEGRYDIRGALGRGGMAAVYRAYDRSLRREVAIKVMSPALLLVPFAVDRFSQEARTMAAMKHPNIVGVHEVVDAPLHYLVMEYVEGLSLDRVLKTQGMLPVRLVQVILFHVAQALQHAHARGVVHRDIKPANIMLDRDGRPMVMDFGIAKAIEGGTQSGATSGPIGTAEYMSPEQILVKPLTGASDQYSLGVVAYRLLAGDLPFSGTGTQVMMGHLQQTPGPLSKYRRDVPEYVEKAMLRMMAKDPGRRFDGVLDAVKALGGHAKPDEGPVAEALVGLAAGRAATGELPNVKPTTSGSVAEAPRRRGLALGVAAGLVVLSVIGAGWWLRRPAPTAETPAIGAAEPVPEPPGPPPGPAQRDSTAAVATILPPPAPPPAPPTGTTRRPNVPPPPRTGQSDPTGRFAEPGKPVAPPPVDTAAAAPSTRTEPARSATDEIEAHDRALVEMMAKKDVGALTGLYRAEPGTDPSWQDKLATLIREDLESAGLASIATDVQPDGATSAVGVNVRYRDPVAGGRRSAVLSMLVRYTRIGDQWNIRSFSLTKKPPT